MSSQAAIAIPGNLDRVPPFAGEHLWTWVAVFRANPGTAPALDGEGLIGVAGICCHYCEKEYEKTIAGRFCQGGATWI